MQNRFGTPYARFVTLLDTRPEYRASSLTDCIMKFRSLGSHPEVAKGIVIFKKSRESRV